MVSPSLFEVNLMPVDQTVNDSEIQSIYRKIMWLMEAMNTHAQAQVPKLSQSK